MLTFEMLRELERKERESRQLQKMPENIINEIRDYIKRKEELRETTDIMELENIKNTVKRLMEIRERKIVEMALYSARTGLPPESLMSSEEGLFNSILDQIKKFRKAFSENLAKEAKEEKISYMVKKDMPEIMGPDLRMYKLNKDEIISESSLPKELNDLLLKQGIIEELK